MAQQTYKTLQKKAKKGAWFTAVRGSYLPISWQGWFLYLPFTAYLIFAVVMGWQSADTLSKAILFIVPNWVAATAVMTWIAKRMS